VTQPLEKPAHLRPTGDEPWLARRKAAVAALGLGVAAFLVVAIISDQPTTPDWRLSVPGFVATAIAAAASLARREPGGYWLWALGLGLAGASLVLGWFLMIAIVIGATVAVILILHAVM
jgi:hypothetical protein